MGSISKFLTEVSHPNFSQKFVLEGARNGEAASRRRRWVWTKLDPEKSQLAAQFLKRMCNLLAYSCQMVGESLYFHGKRFHRPTILRNLRAQREALTQFTPDKNHDINVAVSHAIASIRELEGPLSVIPPENLAKTDCLVALRGGNPFAKNKLAPDLSLLSKKTPTTQEEDLQMVFNLYRLIMQKAPSIRASTLHINRIHESARMKRNLGILCEKIARKHPSHAVEIKHLFRGMDRALDRLQNQVAHAAKKREPANGINQLENKRRNLNDFHADLYSTLIEKLEEMQQANRESRDAYQRALRGFFPLLEQLPEGARERILSSTERPIEEQISFAIEQLQAMILELDPPAAPVEEKPSTSLLSGVTNWLSSTLDSVAQTLLSKVFA